MTDAAPLVRHSLSEGGTLSLELEPASPVQADTPAPMPREPGIASPRVDFVDVPREPCFEHPPEDFIPLETYEAEPDEDLDPPRDGEGDHPQDGGGGPVPDPATNDFIRLAAGLYSSGAAQAFLERRLHLQRTHGDKARTDLSRGPAAIAGDLAERAAAIRDGLPLRAPLTASAIAAAQARLATAGALALALFDALAAVAPAAEPEDDL